jgi:hypothetical protein
VNAPKTPTTTPSADVGGLVPGALNLRPRRIAAVVALGLLAAAPGELGELTRGLMTDAFVQVSVFVAATLLLFYGAERVFRFDMGAALKGAAFDRSRSPPSSARRQAAAGRSSWWRPMPRGTCVLAPSLPR